MKIHSNKNHQNSVCFFTASWSIVCKNKHRLNTAPSFCTSLPQQRGLGQSMEDFSSAQWKGDCCCCRSAAAFIQLRC